MAYIGKSPSGTGVRIRYYFTQTSGGATSISGTDDNNKTLSFSDGEYVDVYLNGVSLVAGTDYNTTTANTIGGLSALANGDVVEVVVYDIFTVADTVSASAGGTFNAGVTINRAGNGVAQTIQNSGTTVGEIGVNSTDNMFFVSTNTGFKLAKDEAALIPAQSGGSNNDNALDLGFSTVRWKDLYLSGGLYVGGTGAVNQLDDYEEGTWTPTDNSGAGLSFTNGDGYYTKVGRQVFAAFRLTYPSTSDTNVASIAGLPFTAGNITDAMFGGSSTYHQDSIGQPFSFLVADNGSSFNIFYNGSSQRGNNNFSAKPLRGFVIYNV